MTPTVLLLMALLALSSGSLCHCEDNTKPVLLLNPSLGNRVPSITGNGSMSTNQALPSPAEIENKLNQFSSLKFDQTNLEWQTLEGSLPNGAISIYNGYVGRIDYVCKYGCEAGFYNPDMGSHCHYPYAEKEHLGSPFEILVNKDNFEILEWKDGSHGSVPQHSVKTCSSYHLYVGKNKYGLGKVDVRNEAFFLPWKGKEYWYKTYQVLTFNKDIKSEHMSDVIYNTDGVEILKYPPMTMRKSAITNHECKPVTSIVTLSKKSQVEQRWDTSFSITTGVSSSITAQIPLISSVGIQFSLETTVQFTKGTTYIESTTHSVTVEQTVPPNHFCSVSMVALKYGADIPYTARLSRTYQNGETTWTSITGTYKSIQIGEVRAVVDRCEPVPDPRPCP